MLGKKQLQATAAELNDVLGVEPAINAESTDVAELIAQIKKAMVLIDPAEDEFSEATQAVLEELEADDASEKVPVKKEKAPDAPAKEKKATTAAKEKFASKKSTGAERVAFLTPLIAKGKSTRKELLDAAQEEFPDVSPSTLLTMLVDAKNPKYNKFDKLVVENENKVMSFAK